MLFRLRFVVDAVLEKLKVTPNVDVTKIEAK